MNGPPSEREIRDILELLRDEETYNRNAAVKRIIKEGTSDRRVIDALVQVVARDPSRSVRSFARSALETLGVDHSGIVEVEPVIPPSRKGINKAGNVSRGKTTAPHPDRSPGTGGQPNDRSDFWNGVGIWFGLNMIVLFSVIALTGVLSKFVSDGFYRVLYPIILWVIPLGANIGTMVYYGKTGRSQVAVGMLAAWGAILVICLPLSAACFGM